MIGRCDVGLVNVVVVQVDSSRNLDVFDDPRRSQHGFTVAQNVDKSRKRRPLPGTDATAAEGKKKQAKRSVRAFGSESRLIDAEFLREILDEQVGEENRGDWR